MPRRGQCAPNTCSTRLRARPASDSSSAVSRLATTAIRSAVRSAARDSRRSVDLGSDQDPREHSGAPPCRGCRLDHRHTSSPTKTPSGSPGSPRAAISSARAARQTADAATKRRPARQTRIGRPGFGLSPRVGRRSRRCHRRVGLPEADRRTRARLLPDSRRVRRATSPPGPTRPSVAATAHCIPVPSTTRCSTCWPRAP
jgi:hypothetical protein